jgi:hypothetical protein
MVLLVQHLQNRLERYRSNLLQLGRKEAEAVDGKRVWFMKGHVSAYNDNTVDGTQSGNDFLSVTDY